MQYIRFGNRFSLTFGTNLLSTKLTLDLFESVSKLEFGDTSVTLIGHWVRQLSRFSWSQCFQLKSSVDWFRAPQVNHGRAADPTNQFQKHYTYCWCLLSLVGVLPIVTELSAISWFTICKWIENYWAAGGRARNQFNWKHNWMKIQSSISDLGRGRRPARHLHLLFGQVLVAKLFPAKTLYI